MKIGRLVYDKKQEDMSKRVFCNYGDNIQTLAMDYILRELFPEEQPVNVNIYDLPTYNGEYVLLPINANFWTCDEHYFLPASDRIIPVFIAVSFQIPPMSPGAVSWLKKWEPIGCRDYETLSMMRKLGIKSYLNGCVTLTLPKRTVEPAQKKTFLVGLGGKELFEYLPEKLRCNIEIIEQTTYYQNDSDGSALMTDERTKQIYQRYHDEAALVITSKLHCASPCIAMGIPTIVIRRQKSCRFEWINKLIKVYTPEEIDKINWSPEALNIEDLKEQMRHVIRGRIAKAYETYASPLGVSEFFEGCEHKEALSVTEQIVNAVLDSGKKEYVIWGVGGYLGNAIYQILSEQCSDVKLAGAIDEFKDCMFHGFQTVRSSGFAQWKDKFVIVATATGTPEAVVKMDSLGMEAGRDYFTFSMIN